MFAETGNLNNLLFCNTSSCVDSTDAQLLQYCNASALFHDGVDFTCYYVIGPEGTFDKMKTECYGSDKMAVIDTDEKIKHLKQQIILENQYEYELILFYFIRLHTFEKFACFVFRVYIAISFYLLITICTNYYDILYL